MQKVLLLEEVSGDVSLRDTLTQLGYNVVAQPADAGALRTEVARAAPDVIIVRTAVPSKETLESLAQVSASSPRAIVVLATEGDRDVIRKAVDCGVAAYVVAAREGVLVRAAASSAVDALVVAALDALFGLTDARTLCYDDVRRGIGRRIRVRDGRVDAVRLAGDVAAEPWLRELFDKQEAVTNLGALLLAPGMRGSLGAPRGRTVCSCWNVAEREISDFLANAKPGRDALGSLQAALKCGTECGSCVPELRRLVAVAKAAA